MRLHSYLAIIAICLCCIPAHASLTGGGQTVSIFLNTNTSVGDVPEPEVNPPAIVSLDSAHPAEPCTPDCVLYDNPAPGDVSIVQGAVDGVVIEFTPTSVTLINKVPAAFCSTSAPCPGESWVFDFKFTGVQINSVALDAATSSDFQPVGGVALVSPTEFSFDVGGDAPAVGHFLTVDVGSSAPVPEPSSAWLPVAGWQDCCSGAAPDPPSRFTLEAGDSARVFRNTPRIVQ